MKDGRKMTARIPVSPEVHEIYKDITQGSGVTFDDILLYFAEQSGAELNKREKNFSLGIHMRERFAEWKAQKKKEKQ